MFNHHKYRKDSLIPMTKVPKAVTLIVVSFVATFMLIVATLFITPRIILVDGKLYTLDESYSSGERSICMAMSPECGVCASTGGAVLRGEKCYVAE